VVGKGDSLRGGKKFLARGAGLAKLNIRPKKKLCQKPEGKDSSRGAPGRGLRRGKSRSDLDENVGKKRKIRSGGKEKGSRRGTGNKRLAGERKGEGRAHAVCDRKSCLDSMTANSGRGEKMHQTEPEKATKTLSLYAGEHHHDAR